MSSGVMPLRSGPMSRLHEALITAHQLLILFLLLVCSVGFVALSMALWLV